MSLERDADGIIVHMNVVHLTLRIVICLWLGGQISSAVAARVTDLYAAQVPAEDSAARDPTKAFAAALQAVLVKVTGRRDAAIDPVIMQQFSVAKPYVQQYRTNPDGTVWVRFDQVAVRGALDRVGQPVWGEERPDTLVWLVMDDGAGRRDMLAAQPDVARKVSRVNLPQPAGEQKRLAAVREILQSTAAERGVPLVLPLVDSEELRSVSMTDVWGGFTQSLVRASRRYGADAILVGRARVRSVATAQVRWTLLLGDERIDWDGDIASGPDRVADVFTARLATSSNASGQLQLRVDGVNSLDDYGRLSRYLTTLDVVADYSVDRVEGQIVVFSLQVRGDANQLMRIIALRRVLQPGDDSFGGVNSSLHYTLLAGP